MSAALAAARAGGGWCSPRRAAAAFGRERRVRPRAVRVDAELVTALPRRLERDGVELEWPHWQAAMSYHSYLVDQPDWYWGESATRP